MSICPRFVNKKVKPTNTNRTLILCFANFLSELTTLKSSFIETDFKYTIFANNASHFFCIEKIFQRQKGIDYSKTITLLF